MAPLWTPARLAALSRYAADGLSAAQIAARIGNTSRDAVIGVARRNNIPLLQREPACAGRRGQAAADADADAALAAYQARTAEAFRRQGDDIAATTPQDFIDWVRERER
jgi:hypothetical protein